MEYLDSLDERMRIARDVLRKDSPDYFFERAKSLDDFNENLLFGYVRSFVKLAYLGDVQKVASSLGNTRQSVKRHILELENLLNAQLFEHVGTVSTLTSIGALWLPKAQEFFEVASAFLSRRGASRAEYQSSQVPLRMLLNDPSNSELLRQFARAWLAGDQTLSCSKLAPFIEDCVIYERQNGRWVSKKIGNKSAYYKWFGNEIALRSEGRLLEDMETGSDLEAEVAFLLDGIYVRGGLHFSEVACNLFAPGKYGRQPLLYQRLLAELLDEEQKPIVCSLIEIIDPRRTNPTRG